MAVASHGNVGSDRGVSSQQMRSQVQQPGLRVSDGPSNRGEFARGLGWEGAACDADIGARWAMELA